MKPETRRDFLKTSARIGGVATCGIMAQNTFGYARATASKKGTKPNILFIIADDMGWGDIGYNNPALLTPNLDRLAKEGIRLTHHYACPTCTPTRVGIMTGHYPSRYGVLGPDYGKIFRDDTVTIADALHKNGYYTALSGKWHMGSPPEWTPLKYGFDASYGYLHGQCDPYTHLYKTGVKSWHRNDKFLEEKGHATDLITNEAIRVIEEERDSPFFLYVAYSVPHYPLNEPQKWLDLYKNEKDISRRWFNASLSHMDDGIGQIVQALERTGKRENTLIVFISDNGGQKNWHSNEQYHGRYADKPHTVLGNNKPLRGWKGDVYEGGIRVPGFLNWPDKLRQGGWDVPMHIVDWMPTLCSLTGSTPKQDVHWDGINLWPAIEKRKKVAPRTMYWKTRQVSAVRQGNWKLVQSNDGKRSELYNLQADPFEKTDLAAVRKEKLESLQALLTSLQKRDRKKLQ